jgi:hypothetical protein
VGKPNLLNVACACIRRANTAFMSGRRARNSNSRVPAWKVEQIGNVGEDLVKPLD